MLWLFILHIEIFKDSAGRPHVSPDGRYLAFHAKDRKGIYNIYIMNLKTGEIVCITDDTTLPPGHKGQPWWHPSGKWIIYQAEKEKHIKPYPHPLAVPGMGFHNDIWIARIENGRAVRHYRLTDIKTKMHIFDPTPSSAILQPNFSYDGKKIAWTQRVDDGPEWGRWEIKVADFVIENDTPKIRNIKTFTPGKNKGYYEANEFSLDGKRLLITGNLEEGQSVYGSDIYWLDLETGETRRLTFSMEDFDECPHLSPDGKTIAFLSTRGFKRGKSKAWWLWARGEFWLMDTDGKNLRRLTSFNDSGRRVIPAYVDWAPDGKTLFLGVVVDVNGRLIDRIYKLQLP